MSQGQELHSTNKRCCFGLPYLNSSMISSFRMKLSRLCVFCHYVSVACATSTELALTCTTSLPAEGKISQPHISNSDLVNSCNRRKPHWKWQVKGNCNYSTEVSAGLPLSLYEVNCVIVLYFVSKRTDNRSGISIY